MWLRVLVNEIFTLRLVLEYLAICILWILIVINSGAKVAITTREVVLITVALTFVSTYYVAFSLLKFEKIKQYISLPGSSLRFILSLCIAIYLWLLATKYSLLISLIAIMGNSVNWLYVLIIAFIVAEWSLMLIFEFDQFKLAFAICLSIALFGSLELIELPLLKVLIYGLIQGGLIVYFKKVDVNRVIRSAKPKTNGIGLGPNYFLTMVANEQILIINSVITVIAAIIFIIAAPYNPIFFAIPFALVALNSGLSTLLSAQPETRIQVETFPRDLFTRQYFYFLGCYYLIINLLLIIIMSFVWVKGGLFYLLIILIVTLVEAALMVGLEIKWPLTNWKIRADLWRHGRKYIPPLVVFAVVNLILTLWIQI